MLAAFEFFSAILFLIFSLKLWGWLVNCWIAKRIYSKQRKNAIFDVIRRMLCFNLFWMQFLQFQIKIPSKNKQKKLLNMSIPLMMLL